MSLLNSRILAVVVGLAGTYLALSLMVLYVVEGLSGLFARRARFLRDAIVNLVGPELGVRVLDNPLVSSLGFVRSKGSAVGVPSYVPSSYFARALLTEMGNAPDAPSVTAVRGLVEMVVGDAGVSLGEAEKRLAAWFDAAMDRLSGAYKRHTQRVSLIIAAVLVVAINVDSIKLAKVLWKDDAARARVSELASKQLKLCNEDPNAQACRQVIAQVSDGDVLPVGWNLSEIKNFPLRERLLWLLGLAISVFAVSRGAPFWFDALRRLTPGLGSSGPPPPTVSTAPAPPALPPDPGALPPAPAAAPAQPTTATAAG